MKVAELRRLLMTAESSDEVYVECGGRGCGVPIDGFTIADRIVFLRPRIPLTFHGDEPPEPTPAA